MRNIKDSEFSRLVFNTYKLQYKNLFIKMFRVITNNKIDNLDNLLLEITKANPNKKRGDIFSYGITNGFIAIFEKNYNNYITCICIQKKENQNEQNKDTQYTDEK